MGAGDDLVMGARELERLNKFESTMVTPWGRGRVLAASVPGRGVDEVEPIVELFYYLFLTVGGPVSVHGANAVLF